MGEQQVINTDILYTYCTLSSYVHTHLNGCHVFIFSGQAATIDMYKIDKLCTASTCASVGGGQHLFSEPSFEKNGLFRDITSQGRKRVERESGD
jgi:hypothetical protein